MRDNPDYLIIGSMKSGTTILNEFICKHPRVVKAVKKEIHYYTLHPDKGKDWYLSHFPSNSDLLVGEASPTYFDIAYTQTIPRLIHADNPNVKLILMIRNPVERAVSHYYHFRNINKIQSVIDTGVNDFFDRPYEEMLKQTTGLGFYVHQVINFSFYYKKFMTYKAIFPDNQILVLRNCELRDKPYETMNKVYDFLELEMFSCEDFLKVKYSSGKTSNDLSDSVKAHLDNLFHNDFKSMCVANNWN